MLCMAYARKLIIIIIICYAHYAHYTTIQLTTHFSIANLRGHSAQVGLIANLEGINSGIALHSFATIVTLAMKGPV